MKNIKLLLLSFVILSVTTCGAFAKEVKVGGYTKKNGTKVEGYTKTVKDPDTVDVKGYTKKDGTKVAGYKRKKAAK